MCPVAQNPLKAAGLNFCTTRVITILLSGLCCHSNSADRVALSGVDGGVFAINANH